MPRVVANRYSLDRLLGRGGMGEVYLAHQLGVGNRVAVKFLALPPGSSEAYTSRFLAEARVGVTLTHPGIAQVLDAGSEPDGTLFIVFEYAAGEDLRHSLSREGRFSWARAKEVVSKVGEALAFAHSRGVVHRDIKPENIRVRSDLVGTHVKVLDFGIARLSGDARLTAEGSFSGTPAYMAPEQALGEDVDGRADLYCLGLLLFELVTGRQAVSARAPAAALMAQLETPLPPLADVDPARASPDLDAFLARACAKRPEQRFPDVVAFLRALHELPEPGWAPGGSVGRAQVTPIASTVPAVPVRKALPVVLVASVAAAAAFLIRPTESPSPPPTAQAPTRSVLRPRPPQAEPVDAGAPVTDAGPDRVAQMPPPRPVVTRNRAERVPLQPSEESPRREINSTGKPPPPFANGEQSCPQVEQFEPGLATMSESELVAALHAVRVTTPSIIEMNLATLEHMKLGFAPAIRDCMHRAQLIASLLGFRTLAKTDRYGWAHAREASELQRLFRVSPLVRDRSAAEREQVLQQVEQVRVATMTQQRDLDYWRRVALADLLTCELQPAELTRLGAERAVTCREYLFP